MHFRKYTKGLKPYLIVLQPHAYYRCYFIMIEHSSSYFVLSYPQSEESYVHTTNIKNFLTEWDGDFVKKLLKSLNNEK